MAGQAVALRDCGDDRPQPRIMGVRHFRKQMVLDLVVQTPGQPGGDARASSKVGRGAELVQRPVVTWPDSSKLHARCEVSNLKDDGEHPAQHDMK